MGIIMVFAVNDRTSFNNMQNWLKQIKTHAAENVVKILVANKIDCPERKVTSEEGHHLSTQFGVEYFEVSAKENTNIEDMFYSIAKEVKEKVLMGDMTEFVSNRMIGKGKLQNPKKEKKGCC